MTDTTKPPAISSACEGEKDIDIAWESLRSGFDSDATIDAEHRLKQLKRLRDMMKENRDDLIEAVHKDLGKHPLEIVASEINLVMGEIEENIHNLKGWMHPEKQYTPLACQPASSYVYKQPLGVVLIISPWNYPINLAVVPLAGAIAAGNCAFLKVSRHAPSVSALLCHLIPKYLDMHYVAVEGKGGAATITKLMQLRWDHVFFTGSVNVGRIVYEKAAKFLTPCTLELGGKNPCIVDDTIDLRLAARKIAWGKYWNAGQTCIGVDYVLVLKCVASKFVEEVKAVIKDFYGENPKESNSFARIISQHHVSRLEKLFTDGEVVVGGTVDIDQRYVAPTVLSNVKVDSVVMQEEIFGPIMPIITVESIDEAVRFIRQRPKPLALYVFSASSGVAESVISRTASGSCVVNDTLVQFTNSSLPFGGVGDSGLGAYHGKRTFKTFSHERAVMFGTTKNFLDLPVRYPPFSDRKQWVIDTATGSLGGY